MAGRHRGSDWLSLTPCTDEDPEKKQLLILIFNMNSENTVITPGAVK